MKKALLGCGVLVVFWFSVKMRVEEFA